MIRSEKMSHLVLRLLRFHPLDEEEIINRLLNKKRLDRDFSVQTSRKHTAKCVVYGFHSTYSLLAKVEGQQLPSLYSKNHVAENIRQEVEYEQVTDHNMTCNIEIMLQKRYVPVHGKNYNYCQVIIWLLVLEIMLQKKMKKVFPEVEYQLPSHSCTFDIRHHVAENTLVKGEPRLLSSHYFTFDNRNHVAENTLPKGEVRLLPSHNLALHIEIMLQKILFQG